MNGSFQPSGNSGLRPFLAWLGSRGSWLGFFLGSFLIRAEARQDTSWVLWRSIPAHARELTTDNLGNVYLLSTAHGLQVYDTRSDTLRSFQEFQSGKLGWVDAGNPLRLLLFYPDFGTILILDRQLAVLNRLDLGSSGMFKPDAACLASDNQIWVYDEQQARLKKIDQSGDPVLESPDLRQVLGYLPRPDRILDQGGQVYLVDTSRGILLFDNYGAYRTLLHFPRIRSLQVFHRQLVFFREGSLESLDPLSLTLQNIPLPGPGDILDASLQSGRLYVLRKDRLDIYRPG